MFLSQVIFGQVATASKFVLLSEAPFPHFACWSHQFVFPIWRFSPFFITKLNWFFTIPLQLIFVFYFLLIFLFLIEFFVPSFFKLRFFPRVCVPFLFAFHDTFLFPPWLFFSNPIIFMPVAVSFRVLFSTFMLPQFVWFPFIWFVADIIVPEVRFVASYFLRLIFWYLKILSTPQEQSFFSVTLHFLSLPWTCRDWYFAFLWLRIGNRYLQF